MLQDAQVVARIKDLLKERGLTKSDLAVAIGVNPKTTSQNKIISVNRMFSRIERAGVLGLLKKTADFLEIPVRDLLAGRKVGAVRQPRRLSTREIFDQALSLEKEDMKDLCKVLQVFQKK